MQAEMQAEVRTLRQGLQIERAGPSIKMHMTAYVENVARKCLGDAFVDHYAATREWEEREFRKVITEWELDRYMEII